MKNILKKIILIMTMCGLALSLTGCNEKLVDIVGNTIKLIDSNSNTAGDVDGIIRTKWENYDTTLTSLNNAGLISGTQSYNTLKNAWTTSKDKMKQAFVTNTSGKADEEIAKHILWFRTPKSIIKIYNQLSMNHIVALVKDGQGKDSYKTSSNVQQLTSKYGIEDEQNIYNSIMKLKVLTGLKVSNFSIFNNANEWEENIPQTEKAEPSDTISFPDEDESVYASINGNWNNPNLCVYYTYTKSWEVNIGTEEQPEYETHYARYYNVYQRGNAGYGAGIDDTKVRTAIDSNKGNIIPIYDNNDIKDAVKGNASETGYRTLRGDGTNTGSNDIDINVDKFTYAIDISEPKRIDEVSTYFSEYESATGDDARRTAGTKIYKSGVYIYDSTGKSDEIYRTTNYTGFETKLEEDYIISRLSKYNGSVDANAVGKDFVLTLGGVPILGIRLNELSDNVMSIIGEGIMEEMDDGYVAVDYIRKNTEDGAEGIKRRGLFPTQLYVSYIKEIDANGNFDFDTSEALYNLKEKMFKQKGSGITDADGKELGEKYDITRSFMPIRSESENKMTLLCLQYFGLFKNEKVAGDQWFPIGRSFVIDRQIVIPSQKKLKDLTSRIGWWENANGEWDKSSANGLYLSDICDVDSYDSDYKIYVLEKGDEDSTESYLKGGSKNSKSEAVLDTSLFTIEQDSGGKYFRYKYHNTNYLYDGWFKIDGTTYQFNSQGYWVADADVSSATNVIGISGDAWHNPYKDQHPDDTSADNYWYYGSTNALLWVTEGKYRYNSTIYEVDSSGYIKSEQSQSNITGRTDNVETIINNTLNKVANYYVNNVATYSTTTGVNYTLRGTEKIMPTCSGLVSTFMKECIAEKTGQYKNFAISNGEDYTRFSTYDFNRKANLQKAGIFTYFDYYDGVEMAGIQLKKGDILVTNYVDGVEGHTEIYVSPAERIGWGKRQTQLPLSCNWDTSEQNNGKIKLGSQYTFTKLIRFK